MLPTLYHVVGTSLVYPEVNCGQCWGPNSSWPSDCFQPAATGLDLLSSRPPGQSAPVMQDPEQPDAAPRPRGVMGPLRMRLLSRRVVKKSEGHSTPRKRCLYLALPGLRVGRGYLANSSFPPPPCSIIHRGSEDFPRLPRKAILPQRGNKMT